MSGVEELFRFRNSFLQPLGRYLLVCTCFACTSREAAESDAESTASQPVVCPALDGWGPTLEPFQLLLESG